MECNIHIINLGCNLVAVHLVIIMFIPKFTNTITLNMHFFLCDAKWSNVDYAHKYQVD